MRSMFVGRGGEGFEDVSAGIHLGWPGAGIEVIPPEQLTAQGLPAAEPDLVVVPLSTNREESFSLLRTLRESFPGVLAVVSMSDSEANIIESLDAGADDYFGLPLNRALFVARIRAALRRTSTRGDERNVYRFGELVIDPDRHEARVDGQALELTYIEFKLIIDLAARGEFVATKETLCETIWGRHGPCEDAALRKHIQIMRRKLETAANGAIAIETVPGVGYRLSTGMTGPHL